ncbi:hypothetical protein C475_08812 [Halosimplex carlsbadense 2-9-1]|uniref:DUF433 domain-containing protein n=1 Tax=Halosimplex carlsbadense 2-9-1 TaxID=797114 RepID=M0CXC3_9EURY|nr:DUF433 domain-containing protein [Halosimplex carlsbadense]ELZ26514.1 hypothetical protein C475_08812 [Halosimplex carlsbadense 2-9-1]
MSGEIARDADVMDGQPRVRGRRIGVHHVVGQLEAHDGDREQVAHLFNLDVDAVDAAVEYASEHPDVIEQVQQEKRASRDRVREQATYPPGVTPPLQENDDGE